MKAPAWPMARPPCWNRPKLVAAADCGRQEPGEQTRHKETSVPHESLPLEELSNGQDGLRYDPAVGHGEDSERPGEMEAGCPHDSRLRRECKHRVVVFFRLESRYPSRPAVSSGVKPSP